MVQIRKASRRYLLAHKIKQTNICINIFFVFKALSQPCPQEVEPRDVEIIEPQEVEEYVVSFYLLFYMYKYLYLKKLRDSICPKPNQYFS